MLSARPARVPSPAQPPRGDGHHQHGTGHCSPADHRGVDTHLDSHVAHANDQLGRRVGTRSVPTTPTGYQDLLAWARGLGQPIAWGVDGTGSDAQDDGYVTITASQAFGAFWGLTAAAA